MHALEHAAELQVVACQHTCTPRTSCLLVRCPRFRALADFCWASCCLLCLLLNAATLGSWKTCSSQRLGAIVLQYVKFLSSLDAASIKDQAVHSFSVCRQEVKPVCMHISRPPAGSKLNQCWQSCP